MHTGLFVAFEGGEGGGKSTQSGMLTRWLTEIGHTVVLTREPGGTDVGGQIRSILLDPDTGVLSPRTESLLYAADKAEHVDTVMMPALRAGHIVVCDRYIDSTLAYQGAGRTLDVDALERVVRWATRDLRPDLTVVMDIDPATGLERISGHDRIEAEPLDFHRRVRASFLEFADRDDSRYLVADASGHPEQIHRAIRERVTPLLAELP